MGSFISKTTSNFFLQSDTKYIDKCNFNTVSWIRFANLKANLSRKIEKNDIKQFPQKDKKLMVDKICGFDFIIHEHSDLKNEISAGLQDMIFGDAIHIINNEKFNDVMYEFFKNNNDAFNLAKKQFPQCLPLDPLAELKWKNWDDVNTLKLLLFYGLGQYYLEKVCDENLPSNMVYKVDFSSWEKYEVRPTFENYGGIAYFDSDLNFVCFVYKSEIITSDDKKFKHVNLIFRSTLITSVTLREHLIMTHWIVANGMLVSSLKYLSPDHILRRFLRSFTYGTGAINHASTIALAPFEGIAGRTFGFTKKSWNEMVTDNISTIKYESIHKRFEHSKLPDKFKTLLPFYKDGMEFWEINKQYVSNLMDIYYFEENNIFIDNELCEYWDGLKKYFTTKNYNIGKLSKTNLIDHLTYSMFMVTGGHSFFGSVCEYLLSPNGLMPKILKESAENIKSTNVTSADIQTYLQALCIISMTSSPMPKLINNWEYLFDCVSLKSNKIKYSLTLSNMHTWQTKLYIQSRAVKELNKTRPIEFDCFDPEILDCSVSV